MDLITVRFNTAQWQDKSASWWAAYEDLSGDRIAGLRLTAGSALGDFSTRYWAPSGLLVIRDLTGDGDPGRLGFLPSSGAAAMAYIESADVAAAIAARPVKIQARLR